MTVCKGRLDVNEATAKLRTRPTQYCLPSRITEILIKSGDPAIRQVGKHRQLHLSVSGVSSAGEERVFEILVDTGDQVSLVCRGLLSSQSLRRSAAPVTLRVANGEIMEGGLHEAQISLEFIRLEQLSRPNLGQNHQIKGLFYEADQLEWDMIMDFDFRDMTHARVLPHRHTLLVEDAEQLRLSTSMEPRASFGEEPSEMSWLRP